MSNTSIVKRLTGLAAVAAAVFVAASVTQVNAQRDPFQKPSFMKQRPPASPVSTAPKIPKPVAPPVNYGPPPVEARIEYFKRLREAAVTNGATPPKVTTVLTLSEIAVTGIYKTPRGYAATVEATPIKLSYTIYPGEKFFDGQLVAVEENRLVFRRVSKVGEGKFVASVENKPLKQYSIKAQVEGTAPIQGTGRPVEVATTMAPPVLGPPVKQSANPFLSPVDEMEKQPTQPAESPKETSKKSAKKPVKPAKKNK